MKYVNSTPLNAVDDSISQTSGKIDLSQLVSLSFHTYFGDATAAGSVKIQASNDLCPPGNLPSSFTVTNWVDIPSASATITSGAPALITINQVVYRWARVVFTNVSGGSTTLTVNMFGISI